MDTTPMDIQTVNPVKLYTKTQTLELLGVSWRTLQGYIDSGQLKTRKSRLGRQKIPGAEILKFVGAPIHGESS